MKAIVYRGAGGPEVISWEDIPDVEPGPEQVRVRVVATAVNRADLLQRAGAYPAPPGVRPDVPGLEFSGVVEAIGPGGDPTLLGREVCGIVGGGAYAERLVVHPGALFDRPEGVSLVESAAIPEAFVTAHDALVTLGEVHEGATVLVHAVGSGVGIAAVQIARAVGARVVGTARGEDKRARALAYGLEAAFDGDGFAEGLEAHFGRGRGADVIVDFVGAGYAQANVASLAHRGRLIVVGLLGGSLAQIDLGLLLRKRARVEGTVLRSRSDEEKGNAVRSFARWAAPRFASGALRPVIDRILPLRDAAEAQRAVSRNENFGKVILAV